MRLNLASPDWNRFFEIAWRIQTRKGHISIDQAITTLIQRQLA
jgi:hypothetical protein